MSMYICSTALSPLLFPLCVVVYVVIVCVGEGGRGIRRGWLGVCEVEKEEF